VKSIIFVWYLDLINIVHELVTLCTALQGMMCYNFIIFCTGSVICTLQLMQRLSLGLLHPNY